MESIFLGSDIEEYPYYLLSAREMTDKEDAGWLKDYINRNYAEEVQVDEKNYRGRGS